MAEGLKREHCYFLYKYFGFLLKWLPTTPHLSVAAGFIIHGGETITF